MKFIDLFAGIGGFHEAVQQVWPDSKCVLMCELDKRTHDLYNILYTSERQYYDVRDVPHLPDADFLFAGFPCQPFSVAGKKLGYDDPRGKLFDEILRLIKTNPPKHILLENVKGLLSHKEMFDHIKSSLSELGYNVTYDVYDVAEHTTLPQHRERVYILASLTNSLVKLDSVDELEFGFNRIVDEKYYYRDLDQRYEFNKIDGVFYQIRRNYVRQNKSGVCPTLTANMGTGGHNVPLICIDGQMRKLTPSECLKLQGFNPNKFPKLSDSFLYQKAGNSVCVDMVVKILRESFKNPPHQKLYNPISICE